MENLTFNQVKYCLKNFEQTRNSDRYLIYKLIETFYPNDYRVSPTGKRFICLDEIETETIRRMRQKLQEPINGQPSPYSATSTEVLRRRKQKQSQMRVEINNIETYEERTRRLLNV